MSAAPRQEHAPVRHNLGVADLTLRVEKRTEIKASAEIVFDAMLKKMGPLAQDHQDNPMPLVLEAYPGGRWFRDTGDNSGHLWGHVQVIKPPHTLEIMGPMFMSYPVAGHIRCTVEETGDVCVLSVLHTALGMIADEHRSGVDPGWVRWMTGIRELAESS